MENIDTVFMAKAIIICALMGMFAAWRWLVWKLRYNKAKWINYKENKLKILKELETTSGFYSDLSQNTMLYRGIVREIKRLSKVNKS